MRKEEIERIVKNERIKELLTEVDGEISMSIDFIFEHHNAWIIRYLDRNNNYTNVELDTFTMNGSIEAKYVATKDRKEYLIIPNIGTFRWSNLTEVKQILEQELLKMYGGEYCTLLIKKLE